MIIALPLLWSQELSANALKFDIFGPAAAFFAWVLDICELLSYLFTVIKVQCLVVALKIALMPTWSITLSLAGLQTLGDLAERKQWVCKNRKTNCTKNGQKHAKSCKKAQKQAKTHKNALTNAQSSFSMQILCYTKCNFLKEDKISWIKKLSK